MKKIFIILLVMVYSTISVSSCEKSYQIYNISNENTTSSRNQKESQKVISSGFGSIGGGVLVYATAYSLQAILGASSKYAMSSTSGGLSTTGVAVILSGSISYLAALRFQKVQKSLKQARVGMGAELAEMKADVEDVVGYEVDMAKFSKTLNHENKTGVFCDPKNRLYKYDEVKDHMVSALQNQ